MPFLRVETVWTGGPSSPGLTVMNVQDTGAGAGAAQAAVWAFWNRVQGYLPTSYTLNVQQTNDVYNEATGQLIGEDTAATAQPTVTGTANAAYAAGVGCRIDWRTTAIVAGRRVRGRTFIVPIASNLYELDGSIQGLARQDIQDAANQLIIDLDGALAPLQVWHRPVNGAGGSLAEVTSAIVPDMVAVLAGRRRP